MRNSDMTREHVKKNDNEGLTLEEVKEKLGRFYAKKTAAKSGRLTNRQVYDVVRGWTKSPVLVNRVLKAAVKAIQEDERLKNENKRIKMSISK
jgi:hypothetical protein